MSKLLVSVRSVQEALLALEGGADLIDIKEPSRGSLGKADDETIEAIAKAVRQRSQVPISAAMGEWKEYDRRQSLWSYRDVTFLKWGISRCSEDEIPTLQHPELIRWHVVLAAYADHQRAGCCSAEVVLEQSRMGPLDVILIDTFIKDGSSLLEWLPRSELATLCHTAHASGMEIALAGSLTETDILELLPLCPDWFAVRGAACQGGQRDGMIDPERIRRLKAIIHSQEPSASED